MDRGEVLKWECKKVAANRRLTKVAVQCSADTFVVDQSLVLRINNCGENRHCAKRPNMCHLNHPMEAERLIWMDKQGQPIEKPCDDYCPLRPGEYKYSEIPVKVGQFIPHAGPKRRQAARKNPVVKPF